MTKFTPEQMTGVWSATPTPLTEDGKIDHPSVKRLVDHHLRLGVTGLFLCGSAGEGPLLTDTMRAEFLDTVAEANAGQMVLSTQVTDNSAIRILDNIDFAKKHGADIAVVAAPNFLFNATPENLTSLFLEAIRNSSLPIGFYDRGKFSSIDVPLETIRIVVSEGNVVLLKDSSSNPDRMKSAIEVRKSRTGLYLLNGNEFDCITYLQTGYDGLMLGGGIFNGYIAGKIIEAINNGDIPEAKRLQEIMNQMMRDVYGGDNLSCWLGGQKKLLVEMGIFNTNKNLYQYVVNDDCLQTIKTALERDRKWLLP